ncbi:M1 family metallopeptidase [Aurantiacibacter aquimixticola]|nr:M1 family metallopeptidase [Aurantiacibacter aquimixticola]
MIEKFSKIRLAAGAIAFAAAFVSTTALAQPAQPLAPRTAESDLPLDDARANMELPQVALAFRVDPANRSISGQGRYTVQASEALDAIAFDLDPRFAVTLVRVAGRVLGIGEYANPDGLLRIPLDENLAAGESVEVDIHWRGQPHVALNPPWEGGFVWSTAPGGEPWIATAVQGEGCDLFWPCIDHSSKRIDRLDMSVIVPNGLVAAGNGALVGTTANEDGTTSYHWRARDPSNYGVTLQIGPYDVVERDYESQFGNTIAIRFWHLPGNKAGARRLVAEMETYLDFFESKFGPYPFSDEKVGVAETPHLGMEHQTINAYGNEYRESELGYDWLLNHEFAHEWFANQLTHQSVNHMWLHEGIAQWMQPLYLGWLHEDEGVYDAEMARFRRQIRNRVPLVAPEGTLPDYNDRSAGWGTDIYYKGAWVMHSLRYLVGEEVLFDAMTRLTYGTDDPQPGNIRPVNRTTDDFRVILEEMTGDDLGWFFDAYFYQAELPRLTVLRDGYDLTLKWDSPAEAAFEMPVEIIVDGEVRRIEMENGSAHTYLPRPDAQLSVDPYMRVLKEELPQSGA